MRAMLRRQTASALGACAAGVALPATVLLLVGRHEYMPGSGVHFWGVGFGAILATVAALSLTIVGWRRDDARTVLVGTAFSVMAALLALHGLATPGMIMGYEGGLGAFTGGATLLLGAAVLALAALPTVTEPQSVNRLVVLQIVLIVAIAILGAVGMLFPTVVPDVPEATADDDATRLREQPADVLGLANPLDTAPDDRDLEHGPMIGANSCALPKPLAEPAPGRKKP